MIEEIINKITNSPNIQASDGDNLLGMDYDVFHCFESNSVFEVEEISHANNNECMFDIKLSVSKTTRELHELVHAIKASWEFLQYRYFEASSLIVSKKSAVFRFVTVIGENQFYVTGKIIVSGTVYEKLAKSA
ncbi:hypothetical protein [Teredinibacter turnerae]|uniref:hypothetical protein n=1 Tax=Teredinibacter turnerae TaxID=2426 RepID=UPI0030CFF34E